ncbi:hypothetical protein CVIRNUC_005131 [Coccomyxa viridis]|uniref:GrpE protein homolog n=1 Tax=Coccomyxa viridis TaxID=1274662 RepID=A0AAV1I3P6_9CHLO|nr:hypothetical protein CVIRNUC_005131 [Coccomyxa viridis]
MALGRTVQEAGIESKSTAAQLSMRAFDYGHSARLFSARSSRTAAKQGNAEQDPAAEVAEESAATEIPGDSSSASTDGLPESTADTGEHEAELQARREEVEDLKDKLARSLADMENLRERTARATEQSRTFAIQKFVSGLLGVADDMERALESVPADAQQHKDPAALLQGLRGGIALTHKTLEKALNANGVQKLTAEVGQKLDPNQHEAMFDIPNPDAEPGTIAVIVKPGYTLNGRVIRPVEVGTVRAVKG